MRAWGAGEVVWQTHEDEEQETGINRPTAKKSKIDPPPCMGSNPCRSMIFPFIVLLTQISWKSTVEFAPRLTLCKLKLLNWQPALRKAPGVSGLTPHQLDAVQSSTRRAQICGVEKPVRAVPLE
eukprot:COSAG02_NODE_12979_length_1465_cov_1.476574_2_plen_124_part_00